MLGARGRMQDGTTYPLEKVIDYGCERGNDRLRVTSGGSVRVQFQVGALGGGGIT